MTRFLVALFIFVAVECLPESSDEVESLPNQRDDNEIPDTDDIDRSGAAHAQAYASVVRVRPATGMGTPIKLVNCLTCVDCPKALANTTSKYCPYTNDPSKNNKCVVYAEKYIQMKKLWYIRGCASERGSCADIKRGHDMSPSVKLSFCVECEGDKCNTNGVSSSTFDFTSALLVLVLCPIFGKYIVT